MYAICRKTLNGIDNEFIDSRESKVKADALCTELSRLHDKHISIPLFGYRFIIRLEAKSFFYMSM